MKPALIIMVSFFLTFAACQRSDINRTEAAPEIAVNNERLDEIDRERDQYIDSMNAKLEDLEASIDVLDERAETMKGDARDRLSTDVMLLRDEKRIVEEKLAYIEDVSSESWTKLKSYVEADMARLEASYENISTRR